MRLEREHERQPRTAHSSAVKAGIVAIGAVTATSARKGMAAACAPRPASAGWAELGGLVQMRIGCGTRGNRTAGV